MNDEHRFADDDGRYRLDSRIATGGMGEVWRATDTVLDRPVAVKLLKPEYADDATFRSRFETEARHAASLHHPGVAGVYDFGESSPTDGSGIPRPFLVMELVAGQPLSALLRAGEPMDPDAARYLMAQAADAIGAAHAAGIVHRDVKPGNLIVTPDREVKITDFGIARAAEGLGLTETGQVMGTPQYLSPEQARGTPATPASDVYSLGVVAYECLAGRRLFQAETAVATALAHLNDAVPPLPDDVPDDLAAVVGKALEKDPARRYPDGLALAAALRDPATAATAILGAGAAAATAVVAPGEPAGAATQVMSSVPPAHPPAPTPVDGVPAATAGTERRRTNPWAAVLIGLLVAVVAVIAVLLLTGDDKPVSTNNGDGTVTVDAADYLGRDADEVRADLEDLGLRVRLTGVANPGEERSGTVEGLNPTGNLKEGDRITVSYWKEPVVTSPSPAPTQETAPTADPSSEPPTTPETPQSPEPTASSTPPEPSATPTTQAPPSPSPTPPTTTAPATAAPTSAGPSRTPTSPTPSSAPANASGGGRR